MRNYKAILVFLITSLAITGVSFLDSQIWNLILLVIGIIAYFLVGLLYSIRLISSSKAGKNAYLFIFVILLCLTCGIYWCISQFQLWVLSWPLWVQITIPTILGVLILLEVIHLIKENSDQNISKIK